jgi:hypothetical protein
MIRIVESTDVRCLSPEAKAENPKKKKNKIIRRLAIFIL